MSSRTPSFKPYDRREVFDLSLLLNELMNRDLRAPWERRMGVYHPSAIAGCKRALYYDRVSLLPRAKASNASLNIFREGHQGHGSIQHLLKKYLKDGFDEEVYIELPDIFVAGATDGVFRGKNWILEIKTVGAAMYSKTTKPKPEHVMQVHLYMVALGIPRAVLLYVNRDNGQHRTFQVHYSAEVWNTILAVIDYVEPFVARREAPPREPGYLACQGCKFAYACKPHEERVNAPSPEHVHASQEGPGGRPGINRILPAVRLSRNQRADAPARPNETTPGEGTGAPRQVLRFLRVRIRPGDSV